MNIFYVLRSTLPNQKAHSVQIFNSSSALSKAGAQVSLVAWNRQVPPGKTADAGQWPLGLSAYFGVHSNFKLVTPREYQMRRLFGMRRRERFMLGAVRLLKRKMQPGDVVYRRTADIACIMAEAGLPVVLEMHDRKALDEPPCKALMAAHPPGPTSSFLGIVAISGTLKDLLASGGVPEEYMTVAHDGIDPSRFEAGLTPEQAREDLIGSQIGQLQAGPPVAELAALLRSGRPVVGYCGHFYEGRGIGMLIECARRRPEWTFLLVGGFEPDIEPYREEVRQSALQNVIFTGYVSNVNLPSFLWACDILVMPYESAQGNSHFMSPMKMFEYMACNRAIVSADWPQIREVLSEGLSVLFHPRGDVDAMGKCIERLVAEAGLRDSLAAHARADVDAYSWEERGRKILKWMEGRISRQGLITN